MKQPVVVLVVEDEVLIRMHIVDTLFDRGFVVFEAGTAAEALCLLQTHPEIRMVFTDVDMPGKMDGLALAAWVHKQHQSVGVIVTSGRVRSTDDQVHGDHFISKPYNVDEVAAVLLLAA